MGRKLKAPELMRARNALIKFLKDNDLDPAKDYSKHPKYGEEYRRLLLTLQIERDKVMVDYPNQDIKNRKKYYKMKKDKKKQKAAKAAATAEAPAKVTKKAAKASKGEKVENKAAAPRGKYDYPLIDGREMTSAEKKKYRAEQRKAASGDAPKAKKEKKEKKAAPEAEATKEKKSKKDKKAPKVGKKEKKKAKKVED